MKLHAIDILFLFIGLVFLGYLVLLGLTTGPVAAISVFFGAIGSSCYILLRAKPELLDKLLERFPDNWSWLKERKKSDKSPSIIHDQPIGLEKIPTRELTSTNQAAQNALDKIKTYLETVTNSITSETQAIRITGKSNIALVSQHGAGKRSILRGFAEQNKKGSGSNIYSNLFFFDASIFPKEKLHQEFNFWLGTSLNISEEIEDLESCANLDVTRGNEVLTTIADKFEQTNRIALVIAEANRIYEVIRPRAHAQPHARQRASIQLFESFLKNQAVDVIVSFKEKQLEQETSETLQIDPLQVGGWEKIRIAAFTYLLDGEDLLNPFLENLSLEDSISLIHLLGMIDNTELESTLTKISRSSSDQIAATISSIAFEKVKKELSDFGDLSEYLIYVLSKIDWPLSENGLQILVSECVEVYNQLTAPVATLIPAVVYSNLKQTFIDYGLLHALKGDSAYELFYYVPKPLNESINTRTLSMSEQGYLDNVRMKITEAWGTQKPSELSKLLARGQFQSVGTRLAIYDKRAQKLSIPLGTLTVGALSPSTGVRAIKTSFLLQDNSEIEQGRKSGQFAVVMSTSDSPIASYWYVRTHIVNRKGSGQDVLKIITRDVGEVVSVTGDAHRYGPGGVIEAIVKINDNLLDEYPDDSTTLVSEKLRRSLQSSVDTYANVQIVRCCSKALQIALEKKSPYEYFDDDIILQRNNAQFVNSEGVLEISGKALTEIVRIFEQPNGNLKNLQVQCYVSRPIGQAIIVFPKVSKLKTISVYLWSKPKKSDETPPVDESNDIAKTFMKLASELQVNLVLLQPIGFFGCRADFEVSDIEATTKIISLKQTLQETGINITILDDGNTEFSEGFGEDAWASMTPETYHTEMRKHLFLPEADAAVVALANLILSSPQYEQKHAKRVLEIGAGTGALTEKLVNSGIQKIDFLEPSTDLSNHWENTVVGSCPEWQGDIFNFGIEDLSEDIGPNYDLIISQGVHHHLMPEDTPDKNLREAIEKHREDMMDILANNVRIGGHIILSDEFVDGNVRNEEERVQNLDKWYQTVIATALFQGNPQLAQMEHSFWRSDRSATGEYKESLSSFEDRINRMTEPKLSIRSVTKFGFTPECPGGFAIYLLEREQ